jgi:hypothetical protein
VREAGRISNSGETSRSLSRKALGIDYDGHNLVFLAGCPRSGTTWLQRLLASHPKIHTGQESNVFTVHIGPQLQAWRKAAEPQYRGGLGLACYFTEEEFLLLLKTYLLRLLEPMVGHLAPGELFLEKTPSNALFLPQIFELLPRARVIHVLRDARDVVSSLISGEAWLSSWAPDDVRRAAYMWANHVRVVRDAVPKLPLQQFREVRYESLSCMPVEVLRECADFLGLEWDPAEISKAVDLNQASKAKATGGTPIPLFGEVAKRSGPVVVEPKGFIRKAKPGAWKNDLSLWQKFWVWHIAHQVMDEADYRWPKAMESAFASLSAFVELAKKTVLSPKRNRK